MLEVLDPGCGGRLLGSKLAEDEIPQERYVKLREFVESMDEQQEPIVRDPLEDEAEMEDDDIEVCMYKFSLFILIYKTLEMM